jgi:cysteine synthase A
VCYTKEQAERTMKKHRYDSIVEGVGLDRVTANFSKALVDSGECVPDQEVVDIAHWVLHNEGLFIGSSSALNIAAAIRTAKKLVVKRKNSLSIWKRQPRIVTIICDGGSRHLSRFWSREFIVQKCNLIWPEKTFIPQTINTVK